MDRGLKNNWIKLLAALCLAVLLLAAPRASAAEIAERTASTVYVNDQRAAITGYYMNGSNYFRLRDLAAALSGTSCRFDVEWNPWEHQVEIITGSDYSGEVWSGQLPDTALAEPSTAGLLVDGQSEELDAFLIGGSTYYRLRDLGDLLGFRVYWLEENDSICLYTNLYSTAFMADTSGGGLRVMNREKSTQRWAKTCESYLFDEGETFSVFDVSGEEKTTFLTVDTYDSITYQLLSSWDIPMELDFFGGFYAGEEYNYIVFGNNNMERDDDREVIRVVQYDKDFRRLAGVSVTGGECATLRPFDKGTLRMSEYGNELVIHTSRAVYAAGDEADMGASLTLILDTETMEIQNSLEAAGSVCPSYNQFVRHDDGQHVLLDQSSAFPRGLLLRRFDGTDYTQILLYDIPGEAGASCTGVTVGGFEVTESGYLAAINTVEHSWVENYTDYTLEGLDLDERDVVLLFCDRDAAGPEDVEQIYLTGYAGTGLLGSTPWLVPLGDDSFLVLWEEFVYSETDSGILGVQSNGVCYVEVDGTGRPLTGIQVLEDGRLSYDCQPIYMGGAVVWYINARAGRLFFGLKM